MTTLRPNHRGLTRAAVILFALCGLLFAPRAGLPIGVAGAAAPCPANKSHLVPWLGGRWYLSGVNVPWQNGGFGADFATVEEWNQHTYSSAATEAMFADLAAKGANSVRWWVFADGRGAPEFSASSGGAVTGFDATTLPSIADAAKLASKHGIYLVFTLWSFDMLFGDGASNSSGEHAGGHRDLIVDAAKRKSYLDNALIPMLRYPVPGTNHTIGSHPNILGWEVINEPEWAIYESGSVDGRISQGVSLAEMQRFVAETAGAIHRNSSQTVTVGSAAMKWNSDAAPGAEGNWWADGALTQYDPQGHLDYYQVHYYSWMNGDGVNWTYSPLLVSWAAAEFDKPVVIGEHPANAAGASMGVGAMLESFHANCYGGAWGWSYNAVDGNGGWGELMAPIGQFNANHAAETRISGSAPTNPGAPSADLTNKLYMPLLRRTAP